MALRKSTYRWETLVFTIVFILVLVLAANI
jgi:cbb3-type cytochrome oxidase subunit 3